MENQHPQILSDISPLEGETLEPAATQLVSVDAPNKSTLASNSAVQSVVQPKKNTYSVRWATLLGISAIVIVGLIGVSAWAISRFTTAASKARNESPSKYAISNVSLNNLPGENQLKFNGAAQLSINGQLKVNNSLVLTPITTPSQAVAGEFYYDKSTNQVYFYNGSKFVSIEAGGGSTTQQPSTTIIQNPTTVITNTIIQGSQGSGGVTDINGQTGSITTGSGLSLSNGTLSSTVKSSTVNLSSSVPNLTVASSGNGSFALNISNGNGFLELSPTAAQTDASTNPSLFINKTGSGNIVQLENNGSNVLTVSANGTTSINGPTSINGQTSVEPTTNSTTAFQVQNNTGVDVLNIDTVNGRIGVMNAAPAYPLDIVGDINTTGAYRINGATICTSLGCTSSSGSSFYIQNGVATQLANFNVESTQATAIAGILQSAAGGSADILNLRNGSSVNVLTVGATGNVLMQPSTNSATAFQVKNATGSQILGVDTNLGRIGINNASPSYALDVNGDINTNTAVRVGGVSVCTQSGCVPATGSNNYIQNSTVVQPNSNFHLRSAATNAVTGVLEGANGQTADILDLEGWNGTSTTLLDSFANNGNLTVNGTINSDTLNATGLTFSGANPVIGASTTNTNLTAQANGTGTLTLNTTGAGTVNLGTANSTTVAIGNSSSTTNVSGTINLNGNTAVGSNDSFLAGGSSVFQDASLSSTAFLINNTSSGMIVGVNNNPVSQTITISISWSTKSMTLPHDTFGDSDMASTYYNGYIYALGGFSTNGGNQSAVYYAQLSANGGISGSWTATTSLSTAVLDGSAVAYNGYIYLMSGTTTYYAPLNANGTVGAWQTTSSLPNTLQNSASAVTYNGYVYLVGGYWGVSSPTIKNTVYYAQFNANGTLGAWQATTVLPSALLSPTTTVNNGYIYALGGYNGSANSTTSYYAPLNANGTVGAWQTTTTLPTTFTYGYYNASPLSYTYNNYIYMLGNTSSNTLYYAYLNSNGTIGAWQQTLNGRPSGGIANLYSTSAIYGGYMYIVELYYYASGTYSAQIPGPSQVTAAQGSITLAATTDTTGAALFQNAYDSTAAFQVQNAAGAAQLTVDTQDTQVNVGSNVAFDAYGTSLLRDATNSTTAFQVQNASGTALFTADTTNMAVTVSGTETVTGVVTDQSNLSVTGTINGDTLTNAGLSFPLSNAVIGDGQANGGLFVQANGAGTLTLNTTGSGTVNVGTANSTTIGIGNGSSTTNVSGTINLNGNTTVGNNDSLTADGTALFQDASLSNTAFQIEGTTTNGNGVIIGVNNNPIIQTYSAPLSWTTLSGVSFSYNGASFQNSNYDYAIGGSSAASVNYIALAGGGVFGGTIQTGPSLPQVEYNSTGAAYNNYAYIIGGAQNNGTFAGLNNTVYYATLNSSTGAIGSWQTGTTFPVSLYEASAFATNGYLYVVGGCVGTQANTCNPSSTVYYATLNASTGAVGTWQTASALPTTTAEANVTFQGNFAYVMATGITSATTYYATLNPSTGAVGAWTATTPLPQHVGYGTVGVNDSGYEFIMGGQNGTGGVNTIYYAQLTSSGIGAWTTSSTTYPNGSNVYAAIYGGYIFLPGGTSYSSPAPVPSQVTVGQGTLSVNAITNATGTYQLQAVLDSTTLFQVQNAAAKNIFAVDTTDKAIALGQASNVTGSIIFYGSGGANSLTLQGPASPTAGNFTLSIPAITANDTLCTNGTRASSCANYAAASGDTNYIDNQTTVQTGNFNIQSASSAFVGGIIQGAASQSADLLDLRNSGGTNLVTIGSAGNVDVGTSGTPTGQLYVSGSIPSSAAGSLTVGTAPRGVYVSGNYAYVINSTTGTLQIIDISNPASPVSIGSVATSTGPIAVFVQGHYAYVATTNGLGSVLQIFDVSNPASPVSVGSISAPPANNGSLYVSGRYAYLVGTFFTTSLFVYDVSNPTAPVKIATGAITGSSTPVGVYVQDRYAYTISGTSNTLQVFDVSNPASPNNVGSVSTGTSPQTVFVQGRYAYVTNSGSNTLQVFNVSNPASPVSVGSVSTGTSPQTVFVQGRYAYVTNSGSNTLQVFDVSSPTSPTSVGTVSTGSSPQAVFVKGRYAYVTNNTSNTLQVFDMGGTYNQQLQAGGVEAGTLQVGNNESIYGDSSIQGGLTVGQSLQVNGNIGSSGSVLFQNSTNSTTAFQVQNVSGKSILAVDTSNGLVNIGAASSVTGTLAFYGSGNTNTLSLQGPASPTAGNFTLSIPAITANDTLCTNGTRASSCANYAAASGDTSYIDNQTSLQTGNFDLQSASSSSVAGIIQGAASQSVDIFDVESSGAVKYLSVGSTGTLTVNGHVVTGNPSGSTTIALGSAGSCSVTTGSSASLSGNDTRGQVTIVTGSTCSAGTLATITFANAFGSAPRITLTPANANASTLQYYNNSSTTTTFTVDTNTGPANSTTYIYNYSAEQ